MRDVKEILGVTKETVRTKRLVELTNGDMNKVIGIVRTSDYHYGYRRNRNENYQYEIIGCDSLPNRRLYFYIWAVITKN